MIPNNNNYEEEEGEEFESDFGIETEPSLTYAMKLSDEENGEDTFVGKADDEDAVRQAILKMIGTERYEYEIYSWNYGVELQDLIGRPVSYAMSEVKRRITEALTSDDRIESIEDFVVEQVSRHVLYCTFTAVTVQGDEIGIESEVNV